MSIPKLEKIVIGETPQFHVCWDERSKTTESKAFKELRKKGCNVFRLSDDYQVYGNYAGMVWQLTGWVL